MNHPSRFTPARLALLTVVLAGGALGSPLEAAVVVVANRTEQPVACTLGPVWGQTKEYSLAPGKLIAVQVSDSVEVAFNTGRGPVSRPAQPNTVQYFVTQADGLDLKPVVFAESRGSPWLHRDREGGPPPAAVVPVKILVDDEQPAVKEKWEAELRTELDAASHFLELYCGVRFEVVASGTWKSNNDQKDFVRLDEEFRQQVNPEPGRLAIGFTSQYRISDATPLRQLPREPLCTRLLLPDAQPKLTKGDHLELLVHELGHYLGAVHSAEPTSVMRTSLQAKDADHRRAGVTIIDPVNTLVMNLIGEELRLRKPRNLTSIPRSTRQYLQAIYEELARGLPQDPDVARYPAMVRDQVVKPLRYQGRWVDGATLAGEAVASWHETQSAPTLAGRALFDPQNPIRWLVDETLVPGPTPGAWVEFVGGDRLPGRVTGFRTGEETPEDRVPPHLLVTPQVLLDWPDQRARSTVRVTSEWVRRIVWTPVAPGYQPKTLFYPDGRELRFRAVRFTDDALKLLCDEGIREVPLADVAELHLAAQDVWKAYFQQLTAISPDGTSRLVQLETVDGLRLTSSDQRFQARSRSANPPDWYHVFQPAWSLDALWIPHTAIRLRRYYQPEEVPLSRIDVAQSRQQSDLGGVWPWNVDRNGEGGPMETGGQPYQWGFGVHALTELEFALPACARAFRTRFGLDRQVGDGGCVQAAVLVKTPAGSQRLFASSLILGSADVFDTGLLTLGEPQEARRLVLLADPAHEQRPAGADPFDIRDQFNWLEPLVLLDAEQLRAELLRHAATRIPAWQHWKVTSGDQSPVRLVNVWDEIDQGDPAFRLMATSAKEPLKLVRRLKIDADRDQLMIGVSRPRDSSASKLEVQVDGQPLKPREIPVRWNREFPKPVIVSLSEFVGREVSVEIVQRGSDERSLTAWHALTLTGRPEAPEKQAKVTRRSVKLAKALDGR